MDETATFADERLDLIFTCCQATTVSTAARTKRCTASATRALLARLGVRHQIVHGARRLDRSGTENANTPFGDLSGRELNGASRRISSIGPHGVPLVRVLRVRHCDPVVCWDPRDVPDADPVDCYAVGLRSDVHEAPSGSHIFHRDRTQGSSAVGMTVQ
jgi:hypothetical protein